MTAMARLGDEGYIFKMGPAEFKSFVVQMAANILAQIPTMPVGIYQPKDGVTGIIAEHLSWSPHGYVNALQTEVEFLYEAVPFITGSDSYLFGKGERFVVASALIAYQEYKTEVVLERQRVNGRRFGEATGFNKKDWTDRNHLLDLTAT